MSGIPLALYIDLEPEAKIDLKTAARAALAWADTIERVGEHINPMSETKIELVSSDPGSQKIRALISGLSPDTRQAIVTAVTVSALFMARVTVAWTWEQVLELIKGPDGPEAAKTLSEDEIQKIAQEVAVVLNQEVGRDASQRVYDELSTDEGVTGVGVTSSPSGKPVHVVPKSEFPPRVYIVEHTGLERRERTEIVDLVLVRANLTSETTKRWGFRWPHGKIGAAIKDQDFLERLASGTLGVGMSEGIVFKVKLEITEERDGGIWNVKDYAILKVISIQQPPQQGNLLHPPQDQ